MITETCAKVRDNGEYCLRNPTANSFFCSHHQKNLYPVKDFNLVHIVPNLETLENILETEEGEKRELKPSSISKNIRNKKIGALDGVFFSLLSPDDRIIISRDDDGWTEYIGNFGRIFLIFKPEILKHYNSHFTYDWRMGDKVENKFYDYDKKYSLEENLNRWSNLLLYSSPGMRISSDHAITANEIVINRNVSMKYLKLLYYPGDIYSNYLCMPDYEENESLSPEFVKNLRQNLSSVYQYFLTINLELGYSYSMNTKRSILRNKVENLLVKPWDIIGEHRSNKNCLNKINWKYYSDGMEVLPLGDYKSGDYFFRKE